jgi:hypothetical protein
MAGTGLYKSLTPADAVMNEPGFLAAWLNIFDDFTTLQQPTLSTPQVIGEAYTRSMQTMYGQQAKKPFHCM